MRPLDALFGMTSKVVHIHDAYDEVVGAAWLRNMRKTGHVTYSGLYGVRTLPGSGQPRVRVVFPLPLGSMQVFLKALGRAGRQLPSALADRRDRHRRRISRVGAQRRYAQRTPHPSE